VYCSTHEVFNVFTSYCLGMPCNKVISFFSVRTHVLTSWRLYRSSSWLQVTELPRQLSLYSLGTDHIETPFPAVPSLSLICWQDKPFSRSQHCLNVHVTVCFKKSNIFFKRVPIITQIMHQKLLLSQAKNEASLQQSMKFIFKLWWLSLKCNLY
jgi:hypothetical protein